MTTIALDLLGGDGAPAVVADAIAAHLADPAGVALAVVGPAQTARALLAERGVDPDAVQIVDAGRGTSMSANPLSTLRAHDDVTVAVAVGLVAGGLADGWVSVGHTGAAVAAAVLGLGRLGGMSRPALTVVVPSLSGPVVLLDVGAATDATPDVLRQLALAGWAYARALGVADPGVGLLSIGSEAGKGDRLRRSTHDLLVEALPAEVRYVGPVEGHDLASGTRAQVVVTDGFTGNVLLKGLEGAVAWSADRMGAAYDDPGPAWEVARVTATSQFAGGVLLGVNGVTVVGHGAGTAHEIVACIRLADAAARMGLVPATSAALARLAPTGSRTPAPCPDGSRGA
jgi:glycerol-3-phosphate acyltransferase PlsX